MVQAMGKGEDVSDSWAGVHPRNSTLAECVSARSCPVMQRIVKWQGRPTWLSTHALLGVQNCWTMVHDFLETHDGCQMNEDLKCDLGSDMVQHVWTFYETIRCALLACADMHACTYTSSLVDHLKEAR